MAPMKINPIILVVTLATFCAITGCTTPEPVAITMTTTTQTKESTTTTHVAQLGRSV